jgi:hypothetical protein
MPSERFKNGYQFVATTWLSTSLLFALALILCYVGFWLYDRTHQAGIYSSGFNASAMQTLPAEEAQRFFQDFDKLGDDGTFEYQPWVGFSERVFHSDKLNVDQGVPLPRRRSVAPAAATQVKGKKVIWMFGGSTMFGWGVPDDQTIPSHLARILAARMPDQEIRVVNNGHCFFYSSQEVLLFQMMLRAGQSCDVAVFLDGLNEINPGWEDGKELPSLAGRAAKAFAREQAFTRSDGQYLAVSPQFPPFRLGRALGFGKPPEAPPLNEEVMNAVVANVIRTYPFNVELARRTAAMKGIKPLFVWQPTPEDYFDPDRRNLRRADMNQRVLAVMKASDFRSLLDIFQGENKDSVYIDAWHYGDRASQRIAEHLADILFTEAYCK